jgi:hypothetical protein
MQTIKIELDRVKARELYRAYKSHIHYSEPMDHEIRRAYQLLAQGRLIIRAIESIKAAGLNDDGLPKLALARSDLKAVWLDTHHNGSCSFTSEAERLKMRRKPAILSSRIDFPPGSFEFPKTKWGAKAQLPIIPINLRPKRGLENYYVLWEAEWTPVPPRDPYLLRRLGKSDLWLVVAMWDLTEVERAVMASRANVA